jgi:hypothetical protein
VLLLCPPFDSRSPDGGRATAVRLRRGRRLLALSLLLIVILLQHRTVWVVVAAMAVAGWALRPARPGQRILSGAFGVTALGLAALAFYVGAFGNVGGTLAASAEEARSTHSTLTWRVMGWQDLLDKPRSVVEWLIGTPFGAGYERYVNGTLVEFSPHDYYLHVGMRLGVMGLALLVAAYTLIWWRLPRDSPSSLPLRVLIVGQLVFFVAYPAFLDQGVLLGLFLWHVGADPTGRVPDPVTPGDTDISGGPRPHTVSRPVHPELQGMARHTAAVAPGPTHASGAGQ